MIILGYIAIIAFPLFILLCLRKIYAFLTEYYRFSTLGDQFFGRPALPLVGNLLQAPRNSFGRFVFRLTLITICFIQHFPNFGLMKQTEHWKMVIYNFNYAHSIYNANIRKSAALVRLYFLVQQGLSLHTGWNCWNRKTVKL